MTTPPGTGAAVDVSGQSPDDPLAAAILTLAAHYGRPSSLEGITAGLPLVRGRLPADHAVIAAERAGLITEWETVDVTRLQPHELPLVIEGRDGGFEILWEIDAGRKRARAATVSTSTDPGRRVRMTLSEVDALATGKVLRLRPAASRDNRADDAAAKPEAHWFFSAFRECRGIYTQAIFATLALNLLALAVPLFSMNVYDRVVPNAAEETLWALAAGVGIAILFDFLIRTLRSIFVDHASQRADVRLANVIYGRLIGARMGKARSSVGVRANTMREFDTLREFFTSATLTAFGDLPFVLLFVGVIFLVAGPLAFVVLAAIPILLAIGWVTQRRLARLIQAAFREAAQKNVVVTETLVGFEAIKTAGAESWAAQKWEQASAEHIRTGHHIKHVSNLGQHLIQAVQTSVQVLIVVFGFYQIAAGHMTMGALIAATILSGRAMQPLSQAATLLTRLNSARMAYQSISAIVDAPQDRPPQAAFLTRETIAGRVTLEGVAFRYADDAPLALDNVSIKVAAGEHVGILGRIGSGKSTVLKLVHGQLAPDDGRVLLDDVSVGQFDPANLRRHVGFLSQGADLFHGSIRENITMGAPRVSDTDLLIAARVAGCLDWVVRLPRGFDTEIAERGAGLSNGQRQSVAFARALIQAPQVMLLDEPTSDMDTTTERAVVNRLGQHADGRTLILVTHRPALLALVDRLIVIDQGRVLHDAPKDEVLDTLRGARATAREEAKRA